MSRNYSAWATISGRVFVEEQELIDALCEKFPDRVMSGDAEPLDMFLTSEQREVFQEVAKKKISDLFPTDEPMKMNEVILDMKTYNS